jgi:hypothetical protein
MARKGFAKDLLGVALRQADPGASLGETCRKLGIATASVTRIWCVRCQSRPGSGSV